MKVYFKLMCILILSLNFGCERESQDGKNSLLDVLIESKGDNCSNGGYKIISGLDLNENSVLDEEEVQQTAYICNGVQGSDGKSSLIDVIALINTDICARGGYKIVTGIDINENLILEESEIQNTEYICVDDLDIFDKQIRLLVLDIPDQNNYGNNGMTDGFFIGRLEKFDIANWPGVDSAIFVTNIQTNNSAHKAFAELYDLTNNSVIINSTVSTNSTNPVKLVSDNIYNSLPEGEINLTIQLRIENSASAAYISGTSYLLLYRK